MAKLMTLDEAAELLKVSVRTVEREIYEGKLRHAKLRGRLLIHESDLADYIDSLRVA